MNPVYIKALLRKNTLPLSMTFFVTNRCNARCKHCFYWKELDKSKRLLSLEEIRKISGSMDDLLLLVLTGGEPFLRKDLPEIAETFYRNNRLKNLVIPTNGLLTDAIIDYSKRILERCEKIHLTVYISLDEIGARHDSFRGVKGLFKKAIETHRGLQRLKEEYKNLNVGILMTVNPENQARVKEIYQSIKRTIEPGIISPILMRSKSKKMDSGQVDINNYDELRKMIREDVLHKNLKGHTDFSMSTLATAMNLMKQKIISNTVREGFQTPCYAGMISATLYEDGRLFPCEMLGKGIGNLRDFGLDFKKAWSSEKAEEIRSFIRRNKCFCTYECAIDTNILFNPKNLVKVLKEAVLLKLR